MDTYSKKDISGLTIEYDVITPPEGPVPYIRFEWDWGPRVYMTGAEFWSLGANGFASALCSFIGGNAGAACSTATSALWSNATKNNRILNDPTCYDFSQALNIGWQKAPAEKCR